MTNPAESKKSLSVLRIYLRRRGSKMGPAIWSLDGAEVALRGVPA